MRLKQGQGFNNLNFERKIASFTRDNYKKDEVLVSQIGYVLTAGLDSLTTNSVEKNV